MLFDMYREKFGEYLPLIRRQDVRGFVHHSKPLWLMRPLGLDEVRKFAARMEYEAERFYRRAAETACDISIRKLLLELAEVEAGISMAFAEALSDDGSLTGRGTPWIRGSITGLMTTIGGLGHTLPYLIPDFWTATVLAIIVVVIELAAISWIRHRYMDTSLL